MQVTTKWWQNDHKVMASNGLVGIDFYEIWFLKSRTCFFEVFTSELELGLKMPGFYSAASGLPPLGRPKWSFVRIPWKKMSFFDFSFLCKSGPKVMAK